MDEALKIVLTMVASFAVGIPFGRLHYKRQVNNIQDETQQSAGWAALTNMMENRIQGLVKTVDDQAARHTREIQEINDRHLRENERQMVALQELNDRHSKELQELKSEHGRCQEALMVLRIELAVMRARVMNTKYDTTTQVTSWPPVPHTEEEETN